jgi:hypothetical protein
VFKENLTFNQPQHQKTSRLQEPMPEAEIKPVTPLTAAGSGESKSKSMSILPSL